MNPENNNEVDIKAEALALQNMPELQSAFDAIEKLKDNHNDDIPLDDNDIPEKEEEEIVEEDQEVDEQEEAVEEEFVPEKPIRERKGDKYRKLQNDKYRALAEKEEALQRLAEMEEIVKESLNSGTYHYSKNVYAELDKAKEEKRKAFEEGDFDAYLNADIALIKSVNAINDLEKWANENDQSQSTSKNYQQDNTPVYQDAVYQEIAKDWIDSHPYLKPHSKSYNAKLAGDVTDFITELDQNLYNNREEGAIFSEEYFDTIDNYIQSRNTPKRDNSKNIQALSNVSGVRNSPSSGGSRSTSEQITLTRDEKVMAAKAGMSSKDWLKEKIKLIKSDNNNIEGRYGR